MEAAFYLMVIGSFIGGAIVGYQVKKMNMIMLLEEIDLLKEKLATGNEEDLRWGIPLKQMRRERDQARGDLADAEWWVQYWLQKWEALHLEVKEGKFQHTCDMCNSSERV